MIKYPHFALDNLFLVNGYRETKLGEDVVHEYEREDELEQCIRRLVLRKPEPLRGWDLRFLRRGIQLSQTDFGALVDRDSQTVARWEKSRDLVPKFVDLMIRARFAERFEPQMQLAELLSFTDGKAPASSTYIQLTFSDNGWMFAFEPPTVFSTTEVSIIGSIDLPSGQGPVQSVEEKIYYLKSGQEQDSFFNKNAFQILRNSTFDDDFSLPGNTVNLDTPLYAPTHYLIHQIPRTPQ